MCGIKCIQNKITPMDLFSDEETERIIRDIFNGVINIRNLDVNAYNKIAQKLQDGVFDGFGKSLVSLQYNSPDYTMLSALRDNVYHFSAAKQYQFTRETLSLIEGNKIKSFADFNNQAKSIFDTYNKNHLAAEYNSAISQARSASQWMTIEAEKEHLPMLTYITAGDGRVRPEHESLNKITRPVDDKFWSSYMPPNGWNCRCDVLQGDATLEPTDMRGFRQPKSVPDEFMFNSGKDRIIYSQMHPYFDVAPKDKAFAKQNFNLPMPK